MTHTQFFFVSLQIWATVFGAIVAVCVYATRSLEVKAAETLVCMLAVDVVLNLASALSILIGARVLQVGNDVAWLFLRVIHLCEFLFLVFTSQHVARVIAARGGTPFWVLLRFVWVGGGRARRPGPATGRGPNRAGRPATSGLAGRSGHSTSATVRAWCGWAPRTACGDRSPRRRRVERPTSWRPLGISAH